MPRQLDPPARSIIQFGVRLPPDLKDWLRAEADKNRRSLNAEIVYRLNRSRAAEQGGAK